MKHLIITILLLLSFTSLHAQIGPNPLNSLNSWRVEEVYSIGQTVIRGGVIYQSLVNSNVAFDPAGSPSQWTTIIGSSGYTLPTATGAGQVLTSTGAGTTYTAQTPSGGVTGVTNSDGTLTVSPTTGAVVASLNLAHANTWTANAAASTPGVIFSGATFGGNGTNSTPLVYINAGTAPTTWSNGGTEFGINAASGFAGNMFDFHLNGGTSLIHMDTAGNLTVAGAISLSGNLNVNSDVINFGGNTTLYAPGTGNLRITETTGTSFNCLYLGATTSSWSSFCASGANLQLKDGSGGNASNLIVPALAHSVIYSAAGTALPSCVSGIKGQEAVVSDSTTPTYLGTYASGGAVASPVMCNGTNWVTY